MLGLRLPENRANLRTNATSQTIRPQVYKLLGICLRQPEYREDLIL